MSPTTVHPDTEGECPKCDWWDCLSAVTDEDSIVRWYQCPKCGYKETRKRHDDRLTARERKRLRETWSG